MRKEQVPNIFSQMGGDFMVVNPMAHSIRRKTTKQNKFEDWKEFYASQVVSQISSNNSTWMSHEVSRWLVSGLQPQ